MAPLLTEEESALDPYVVLKLEVHADAKDIKKSYRQLALSVHPDKNPSPEAAIAFRQIQVALGILEDAAKRAYIDTKLENERKRKAKYEAGDKKRKELIDALVQREEEAKKARVDRAKKQQEDAAEGSIIEAGRRMLEEAQKRQAAAAAAASAVASSSKPTGNAGSGSVANDLETNGRSSSNSNGHAQPPISALDLTLILTLPPAYPDPYTLQDTLAARYGHISGFLLKDPAPVPEGTKKKKVKGKRAIVEFEEGNWGGCYACWRDHEDGAGGKGDGVKAKWFGGKQPDWVDWAKSQSQPKWGSEYKSNQRNTSQSIPQLPEFTSTTPSFSSAPNFASTTMADLLAQHKSSRTSASDKKRQQEDYESMTLLKMRQMERDKLAEQIRREEEEEEN